MASPVPNVNKALMEIRTSIRLNMTAARRRVQTSFQNDRELLNLLDQIDLSLTNVDNYLDPSPTFLHRSTTSTPPPPPPPLSFLATLGTVGNRGFATSSQKSDQTSADAECSPWRGWEGSKKKEEQ